jgi:hypothetical protein
MGDERVLPLVDWTSKANGSIKFGKLQHLGHHEFEFAPFSTFSPLKLEVFLSFFQHQ